MPGSEFKVLKPAILVENNPLKSLTSQHNIKSGCYEAPNTTFIPNGCLYTERLFVCITLIWMNSCVFLQIIRILSDKGMLLNLLWKYVWEICEVTNSSSFINGSSAADPVLPSTCGKKMRQSNLSAMIFRV